MWVDAFTLAGVGLADFPLGARVGDAGLVVGSAECAICGQLHDEYACFDVSRSRGTDAAHCIASVAMWVGVGRVSNGQSFTWWMKTEDKFGMLRRYRAGGMVLTVALMNMLGW